MNKDNVKGLLGEVTTIAALRLLTLVISEHTSPEVMAMASSAILDTAIKLEFLDLVEKRTRGISRLFAGNSEETVKPHKRAKNGGRLDNGADG